jgi:uncharacterized protein YgbK (DUF1537 family)
MTERLLFAAVADDDTGASDLAGMLADQGVRPVLVLDDTLLDGGSPRLEQAQAIVLATATRALPRDQARAATAGAVRRAAELGPRTIEIKYCSTFDSTAEGNIGPSLDAAMETMDEPFTIAVPALPVNGRTTYCGYHFVRGQLLSDSPMRHHPLTPMTNANLVEHLQRQTARRVGLTPSPVVAAGAGATREQWAELRAAGTAIAVVDCLDEAQAAAISEAACELRLVSGSSTFGMHLPAAWRRRGWLEPLGGPLWGRHEVDTGRGRLVVAGSCSVATSAQNAWLAGQEAEVVEVDGRALLEEGEPGAAERAIRALGGGGTVLVKTRSTRAAIEETQQWGLARGWQAPELGLRLAGALASLARQILEAGLPEALVCAGGETTGAICRALGIRGFAVDRNIQPGVPLCFPLEGARVPMALKSGNFGGEDFYGAAFAAAAAARR